MVDRRAQNQRAHAIEKKIGGGPRLASSKGWVNGGVAYKRYQSPRPMKEQRKPAYMVMNMGTRNSTKMIMSPKMLKRKEKKNIK